MSGIQQWWDVVERLRDEPLSRSLRRQLERWLLGRLIGGEPDAGVGDEADLATRAVQAEVVLVREALDGELLLPALVTVALGERLLAAREVCAEPGPVWQRSFELLGRRLAWSVLHGRRESLEALRAQAAGVDEGDAVLLPVLERARRWLEAARLCPWMGLGRVPALLVLEGLDRGLLADVAVLVQPGSLGDQGLSVELGCGPESGPPIAASPAFCEAVVHGALLGVLACDVRRASSGPLEPLWSERAAALGPLAADTPGTPAGPGRLLQGAAAAPLELGDRAERLCAVSALARELRHAGTRIEVALGAGGLTHLDGQSLALAVAVATADALEDRGCGRPADWTTALTGVLSAEGRLLSVGGLSSKAEACLGSRLLTLVGPHVNRLALRELEARVRPPERLRIVAAQHLLDVLARDERGREPRAAAAAGEHSPQGAGPPAASSPPARRPRRLAAVLRTAATFALSALSVTLMAHSLLQAPQREARTPNLAFRAAVTWPSEEHGGRLAPDGRSIAFVSNRGGTFDLWLQPLDGGAPRRLTEQPGAIYSSAWSPDGAEIACLVRQDGQVLLRVLAASGAEPRLELPLAMGAPALVRWHGSRLYLASDDALWVLDRETRQLNRRYAPPELRYVRGFDVLGDERRVVFSAARGGQWDLWLADLTSASLVQLTDDPYVEQFPRWSDRQGASVVYSSDEGGQTDLWSLRLDGRVRQRLTSDSGEERVEDAAPDGSSVLFWRTEDDTHLHGLDLETGRGTPLTADTLPDLWPSAARDAGLVAFQRRKPYVERGHLFAQWQVLLGRSGPGRLEDARPVAADGYAARLSPDGRWLAFLRTPAGRPNEHELWLEDLQDRRTHRLAARFPIGDYQPFPVSFGALNLAWSADSLALYFVDASAQAPTRIVRAHLGTGRPLVETLSTAQRPEERLQDLALSADGRWLGHLRWRTGSGGVEVRALDLLSEVERVLVHDEAAAAGTLFLRGWTDGNAMLALRLLRGPAPAGTYELLEIDATGARTSLNTAEGLLVRTARFDPVRQTLYATRVHEGPHNLYAISLPGRAWRRLTDNTLPGVSFCGIEPGIGGSLLYTRHRQHRDLWVLRREP